MTITSNTIAHDAGYVELAAEGGITWITELGAELPLEVDWKAGTIWADPYVMAKVFETEDARELEQPITRLISRLITEGRINGITQRREEEDLFDVEDRAVWVYNLDAINAVGEALGSPTARRFRWWTDHHVYVSDQWFDLAHLVAGIRDRMEERLRDLVATKVVKHDFRKRA